MLIIESLMKIELFSQVIVKTHDSILSKKLNYPASQFVMNITFIFLLETYRFSVQSLTYSYIYTVADAGASEEHGLQMVTIFLTSII